MRYLTILITLLLLSCQSPAPIEPYDQEGTPREVTFSISASTTSLGDIIAVQIYQHDPNGAKIPYAYGLFNSYSIPPIELTDNLSYSITVSSISEGQSLVAHHESKGYQKPFVHDLSTPTPLENRFTISQSSLNYLSSGTAALDIQGASIEYDRPQLKRYAGYSGQFSPSDNLAIDIELRRVYSTLRITTESLSEGSIELLFNQSQPILLTPETTEVEIPISLSGTVPFSNQWAVDGYSELVVYSARYIDSQGVATTLVEDASIELIRGTIHPITIKLDRFLAELSLTIEEGEMEIANETIIE